MNPITFVVMIISLSAIFSSYVLSSASGGEIYSRLFSIDETPYGLPVDQWVAKWWNWFLSFPQDKSPSVRDEDEYCTQGQHDENVLFLTGANGEKHIRKCSVESGKSIFFGHGYECSEFENPGVPVSGLADCGLNEIKAGYIGTLDVLVDGMPINNITDYGVLSGPFDLYYPPNNIFGVKNGTAAAGAYTYVIFLKSLPPGQHTLNVRTSSSPDYTHPSAWEVTYLLNVR